MGEGEAVGVGVGIGVGLYVGVGVGWDFGEADAEALGVGVGSPVAVGEGVAEALGVGVNPPLGRFVADITYATTKTDKQAHANKRSNVLLLMFHFHKSKHLIIICQNSVRQPEYGTNPSGPSYSPKPLLKNN